VYLVKGGKRVAVLAVDPSSGSTGGSILGDKTRMAELCERPEAFVRPSPSSGTLGGVASKTREAMLLCEAAGFDVVLVETVGVGQSETVVADMTDFMMVLALPGAGDELQGIKRGVLELADAVVVNKADGENMARARRAMGEYVNALHLQRPTYPEWSARVLLASAAEKRGLGEVWQVVLEHRAVLEGAGHLARKRSEQMLRWMWSTVDERLRQAVRDHAGVRDVLPALEKAVLAGNSLPTTAAISILEAFGIRED
jgi:LAO/AO transport system kinase